MAQRGRPKSLGPTLEKVVPVRFTEDEHAEVSRAAEVAGVSLSAYLRMRGLAAANRPLRRGGMGSDSAQRDVRPNWSGLGWPIP